MPITKPLGEFFKLTDTDKWGNHTGDLVEYYIKEKLENNENAQIVGGEYNSQELKLFLRKKDGSQLEGIDVTVTTPNYASSLTFTNFYYGTGSEKNVYNVGAQIPYSEDVKFYAGINLQVYYELNGRYNSIDQKQDVVFIIPSGEGSIQSNVYEVTPLPYDSFDEIIIDITNFIQPVSSSILSNLRIAAYCKAKTSSWVDDLALPRYYESLINIIKLEVEFTSDTIIIGRADFNVNGVPTDRSGYVLEYYDISLNDALQLTNSNDYRGSNHSEVSINDPSVSIPIDTNGVHLLYVRAKGEGIYSNWLQVNIINKLDSYQGVPLACVSNFAKEIKNCDTTKLFEAHVVSGNGGDVKIYSYMASTSTGVNNSNKDDNIYKITSYTGLVKNDSNKTESFYSYNEFTNITENTNRYIRIDLEIGGTKYVLKNLYISNNRLYARDYQYITIVQNPANIDNAFNYTTNPTYDFSQITGQNNGVFSSDNIDENLDSNDGYTTDDTYTVYKVSAQYSKSDGSEGIFKNPINLNSLKNQGKFTIDVIYKSENVNGEDPLFTIGNIQFGPGYTMIKGMEDSENINNSDARYQKEQITHIILTYDNSYKPLTYNNVYKDFFPEYESYLSSYQVVKIYVNGCINREIMVTASDLGDFKLQIHPISSDLKLYQFRTYQKALNYNEILKNTISGFRYSTEKVKYYNSNNILNSNGTISFYKAMQNCNVLVHVLPYGTTPVWYGQTDVKGSSLLIHYSNPSFADYCGKFIGETPYIPNDDKNVGMTYKNLGSSANKYMFHNTSIAKFKFIKESDLDGKTLTECRSIGKKYYYMPNDNITQIKKLVGKVNYASSMQSHKLGACKTFNDTYNYVFAENINEKLYTQGKKAVNEYPFLYFYYVCDQGQNPEELNINDIYIKSTDALGNIIVNDSKVKFFGFLTWGSAKGDKATSGYNDNTPEYLLMEGADNSSLGANFKQPWAALQWKEYEQLHNVTKEDRVTGLNIAGETITFERETDPWDVDFGIHENGLKDSNDKKLYDFDNEVANNSLKYFADFCDDMYKYDFMNIRPISGGSINTLTANDAKYRYIISDSLGETNGFPKFNFIRYDQKEEKWVLGGTEFRDGKWTLFKVTDFINSINRLNQDPVIQKYIEENGEETIEAGLDDIDEIINGYILRIFPKLFKISVEYYTDVDDIAFHQAMIRVITGTDNRAKNTYYQIIGKLYQDTDVYTEVSGELSNTTYYKKNDEEYVQLITVQDGETFKVKEEGREEFYTGTIYAHSTEKVKTNKGDYKIRLLGDDLDTIFKTNNNGQQVIPYYLLEPVFNENTNSYWNDFNNALFYAFDFLYEDKILDYTKKIIDYLIGSSSSVSDPNCNLYKNFFAVQNDFPEIAYNHHAEIYYEIANMFYQSGLTSIAPDKLQGFVNNGVPLPLSLIHGRTVECEYQFMTDRLIMLGSMVPGVSAFNLFGKNSLVINDGSGGEGLNCKVSGKVSTINYLSPVAGSDARGYESLLKLNIDDIEIPYNKSIKYLIDSDDTINTLQGLIIPNIQIAEFSVNYTGNIAKSLLLLDYYKTIKFTEGLDKVSGFPSYKRASKIEIDGIETSYKCRTSGTISIYDLLPAIEELYLKNVEFLGSEVVLDFRHCSRLRKLDLSGSTGIKNIILPDCKYLESLKLPNGLEQLNIGYTPKLNFVNINGDKSISTITINGNNKYINDILIQYCILRLQSIRIHSLSSDFYLTEESILKIANAINVDLKGSIIIGNLENDIITKATISLKTKQILAEKFGNIDDINNDLYCDYNRITPTKVKCRGSINVPFSLANPFNVEVTTNTGNPANNVSIVDNRLDITYTISPEINEVTVDQNGNVIVQDGYNSDNIFTVTIKVAGISQPATCSMTIGFYTPKLGDFAYADGHFDTKYDPSQDIVGFVYYVNTVGNNIEVRIMSASASSINDPLGPADYAISSQSSTVYKTKQQAIKGLITYCKSNNENDTDYYYPNIPTDINSTPSLELLRYTSNLSQPSFYIDNNTSAGEIIKNLYLSKANYILEKVRLKFPVFNDISITEQNYNEIKQTYNNLSGQGIAANNYYELMFPAFQKVHFYKPENLSNAGILYYDSGKWYIPTHQELTWILQNRVNAQCQIGTGTDIQNQCAFTNNWNSAGDGFFKTMWNENNNLQLLNIFDIFNISSSTGIVSCNNSGVNSTAFGNFSEYWNSSNNGNRWCIAVNVETLYLYPLACRRDYAEVKVIPCCKIILLK